MVTKKEALEKWKQARREDRDKIYADIILPIFKEEFASKPLEGWPYDEKPEIDALISVLGFSWQPLVLMSIWINPKYLLVIGTEESISIKVNGKTIADLVSELAGIPRSEIELFRSGDNELEIYRKVKEFVTRKNVEHGKIAVDLTGGKKYMSAVTALAGFLTGCLLMYVDYKEYDPSLRAPLPFSEYPKLIHNPLDIFGDTEKEKIISAFNSGKFDLAHDLAKDLTERLYDTREIEVLRKLALAYKNWHGFNFEGAFKQLESAKKTLDRFEIAVRERWFWYTKRIKKQIESNLTILNDLKSAKSNICEHEKYEFKDIFVLVMNHLASAKRYANYGEYTIALMLLYSTVEKICDAVLLLEYGIKDEKPNYSKIKNTINWTLYHNKGKKLIGPNYEEREPSGPITYTIGVQLVSTLKPEIIQDEDLSELSGLAQLRNKCEFEHGLCPKVIAKAQFNKYFKTVKKLVENFAKAYDPDIKVEKLMQDFQFPEL